MIGIKGLHHNAYRCRDSEETRKFYEDFLGLPLAATLRLEETKTGRRCDALHTFYQLRDGSYLAFFEVPDMPHEFIEQHDYDLHIALEVGHDHLVKMFEKGKAAGRAPRGVIDHHFIHSIYFRDPNGYVIELTAKQPNHDEMTDPAKNRARAILEEWQAEKPPVSETMIVEQIWTGNNYRNFNYLVACPETGEALAIDPLDHEKCLGRAKARGFSIRQILNTHEHPDYTGGNEPVRAATGAKVLAHRGAKDSVPHLDVGLSAGDVVRVGKTVELEVLDTPGHTMSHVCLLSRTDEPALFSGDTLFNAGAGNCHNGGHPEVLYTTFAEQLSRLPDATRVHPGHDYIANNLGFTLDREPDNARAQSLIAEVRDQDPAQALVTTLALEKQINTFFRLTSPSVAARLREAFPDLPEHPDARTVFLKLRELRNSW